MAFQGRGLLILGSSGAGKSALALDLVSRGATLVSDDRVVLQAVGASLVAQSPPPLVGLVEARDLAILRRPTAPAAIVGAVDLDHSPATERLPQCSIITYLDIEVPICPIPRTGSLAAPLLNWLIGGPAEI